MFLHSGIAAHRHEYSPPLEARSSPIPKRSPLTRAPFSTPLPRRYTTYPESTPGTPRTTRPLSDHIPRLVEQSVRFQELDSMSEDGRSVAGSEASEGTTMGKKKRRRRSARTSTTYNLAHPAPTLTQKQRLLQIRPKLLLQVQKISSESRPRPALDVLPSTQVVPRLTKKFPRMFRGKGELGVNDVMVVRSEEYDAPEECAIEHSDSDEENVANREVVAVICQLPKDCGRSLGKAEIVLSDGSVWVGTPLATGCYELTTETNGEKTTARWVRRPYRRQSAAAPDGSSSTADDYKFTFSILDPNSRRHPIIATVTQDSLDITDSYVSVSPSAGKCPPTSPMRTYSGDGGSAYFDADASERTTYPVDERLKTLIQVTATWVILRQNWCPAFKYSDSMTIPGSTMKRNSSTGRVRSASLTPDAHRPNFLASGSSTPDSTNSTLGAVGNRILRTVAKGSPNGVCPSRTERPVGTPKRTVSTGSAFMQRAVARRAGSHPSPVMSDFEGEAASSRGYANSSVADGPPTPSSFQGGTGTTTPDTPTRSQRRVQSAYIPRSALQHEVDKPVRPSRAQGKSSDSSEQPKSRWKVFTSFFRRSGSNRSSER